MSEGDSMDKALIKVSLTAFILCSSAFSQLALADRLTDALANLTRATYGEDRVNDLDDGDKADLAEGIADTADAIDSNGDQMATDHIIEEHEDGDSTRTHVSKCPYCRAAAVEVADNTPLRNVTVPNKIPRCFGINGKPYGADPNGQLLPLHPQTLQQTGYAEGYIWFQGGQYIGVGYNGSSFIAQPFNC